MFFNDMKESAVAASIKAHFAVSIDQSVTKLQVGPFPKSLTQAGLDELIKRRFPLSNDIKTELRLDMFGRSRGCAWITVPRSFTQELFKWDYISEENRRAGTFRLKYRKCVYPKELHCWNCFARGHLTKSCTSPARCGCCGKTGHAREDCKEASPCLFCKQDHITYECKSSRPEFKLVSPAEPSSSDFPAISQSSSGPQQRQNDRSFAAVAGPGIDHKSVVDQISAQVFTQLAAQTEALNAKITAPLTRLSTSLDTVLDQLNAMSARLAQVELKNAQLEAIVSSIQSSQAAQPQSGAIRRRRSVSDESPPEATTSTPLSVAVSPSPSKPITKKSRVDLTLNEPSPSGALPTGPTSPMVIASSPVRPAPSAASVSHQQTQGTRQLASALG